MRKMLIAIALMLAGMTAHAQNPHIEFSPRSAEIQDLEKDILMDYVEFIKDNPDANVVIEGHADKGFYNKRINQRLSEERAAAVKGFLIDNGIAETRVLETYGLGDRFPNFDYVILYTIFEK